MHGAAIIAKQIHAALYALALLLPSAALAQDEDAYADERRALIAELRDAPAAGGAARIESEALELIAEVPRHRYVPADQRDDAYDNRPLSIGYGQTISQPYIVALMTSLVEPDAGDRILEVGTGSGYQAAVLAESGAQVHTVEIIEPLAKQATRRLRHYDNVETRHADGYYGWKAQAPFDAIVVTAAAHSVPPPLIAQLAPGGRMVIPVGSSFFTQNLMLVRKDADGQIRTRQILPVRFVPLTGRH